MWGRTQQQADPLEVPPFAPGVGRPQRSSTMLTADSHAPSSPASSANLSAGWELEGTDDHLKNEEPEAFLAGLISGFGSRLLVAMFFIQHVLKGFIGGGGQAGLAGAPIDFVLKEYGVSAADLQVYQSAIFIPWSLKPLMGVLSDRCPIGGYHKRPYLLLSTLLALVAYGLVGGVGVSLPLTVTLLALFVIFLNMSTCDLLVEAKYAEKIKLVPEKGPDLITFVWGGIACGRLLATALVGAVIQNVGPFACYLLAIPFVASVLWPILGNFLDEQSTKNAITRTKHVGVNSKGHSEVLLLSLVSGIGGLFLSVFSIFVEDISAKVVVASLVSFVTLGLFTVLTRPVIAKQNLFFFLQNTFNISIHGASFYYFTDPPSSFPDGPHFSPLFYATAVGLVGTFFGLLGMAVYNWKMKEWNYRSILMISNLLWSLVSLLNVVVFKKWNRNIGISDAWFVVGSSAVQTAVGEFSWMPGIVLLSASCPDGLESTMYALLAGSFNLGMSMANYFGAGLLRLLHVEPRGATDEGSQFDNLWIASVFASFLPLLPLLLIPFLIPDARQTEPLLTENRDDACAGSLYRTWLAKRTPQTDPLELEALKIGKNGEETEMEAPRKLGAKE